MSAGDLPYHLRLNKNIERQVLLDMLSRISSYRNIEDYTYVGFGGPFLEDFKVLHNHFQISQMYSIEMSEQVLSRQLFNKPSSCISCINTTSEEMVDKFPEIKEGEGGDFVNIDGSIILWLDYTSTSSLGDQVLEFCTMIDKVEHGSIIKITVNAAPNNLVSLESLCPLPGVMESISEKHERLREERLKELEDRLGDTFFQKNFSTPEKMNNSNYPSVLYKTLLTAAFKALEGIESSFFPLCAFEYSDGQKMLTLTGVVLKDDELISFKEKSNIENWEYYIGDSEFPMEINVPYLSVSEKLRIDKFLPGGFDSFIDSPEFQVANSESKTKKALENYRKFYRFYPSFTKVWV